MASWEAGWILSRETAQRDQGRRPAGHRGEPVSSNSARGVTRRRWKTPVAAAKGWGAGGNWGWGDETLLSALQWRFHSSTKYRELDTREGEFHCKLPLN